MQNETSQYNFLNIRFWGAWYFPRYLFFLNSGRAKRGRNADGCNPQKFAIGPQNIPFAREKMSNIPMKLSMFCAIISVFFFWFLKRGRRGRSLPKFLGFCFSKNAISTLSYDLKKTFEHQFVWSLVGVFKYLRKFLVKSIIWWKTQNI